MVTLMPGGRLTREVLRSRATAVSTLKRAKSEAVGLLVSTSKDGAFRKRIHRYGEHDIGLPIDKQLGLEEETNEGKSQEATTTDPPTK